LQQEKPDDYVIATGESYSVREFVELAASEFGYKIEWQGKGINEKGVNKKTGEVIVEVSSKYFRPAEVDFLCGKSFKAEKQLKWKPKTTCRELGKRMTENDKLIVSKEKLLIDSDV
jgi:GDPmannose 4,6-dehydratase